MSDPWLSVLTPDHPLHEETLDHTFPLWNDGLSRPRYGQYNRAQLATRWGERHLQRVGLVDRSRLLASAKRYTFSATLDGRERRVLGIGAVFTPEALRGRGLGRRLIERLIAEARADGVELAMLFSEIGPAYYERLGFSVVPLSDVAITVQQGPGAPGVPLRSGDERDLPALADMHRSLASAYRLALSPDEARLQYVIARKRMLAALDDSGTRAIEFFVAEEGGRAAAWLLVQVVHRPRSGHTSWTVEAAGDRDPSGARVGAMLQALLARTPGGPMPVIRAWWPATWRPPQIDCRPVATAPVVFMLKPLADDVARAATLRAADVLYWHLDAF